MKGLKNLRIDAGRSRKKLCARTLTLSHSASTGKMRMLLASFVAGLAGVAGRHVRYQNPQTLQHALSIALCQRGGKAQRFSETFYAKFDE
jgi:hypothetical protein